MAQYLVKTANFVAQIEDDEQLLHLAVVDTLKKKSLVKRLPDGQWQSADLYPELRKIWGLSAQVPAAPPPPPPVGAPAKAVLLEGRSARVSPPSKPVGPPSLETIVDYRPRFEDITAKDDEVVLEEILAESELRDAAQLLKIEDIVLEEQEFEYTQPDELTHVLVSQTIERPELLDPDSMQSLAGGDVVIEHASALCNHSDSEAMQIIDDLAVQIGDEPGQRDEPARRGELKATLPLVEINEGGGSEEEPLVLDVDFESQEQTTDFKRALDKMQLPALEIDFGEEDETAARALPAVAQNSKQGAGVVSRSSSTDNPALATSLDSFLQNEDFSSWLSFASGDLPESTPHPAPDRAESVSTNEFVLKPKAPKIEKKAPTPRPTYLIEEAVTHKQSLQKGLKQQAPALHTREHNALQDIILDLDLQDENPSEKLKVHSRSELLKFAQAQQETLESESSIEIDEHYSSESLQPQSHKDLRNLFENQDELHLYLASEIEASEAAPKDADNSHVSPVKKVRQDEVRGKNGAIKARPAAEAQGKEDMAKFEPTALTAKPSKRAGSYSNIFTIEDRLVANEHEIARFKTLGLTNLRLWNLNTSSGLYESYNLDKITWVALRHAKSNSWLWLTSLALIASLCAFYFLQSNVLLIIGAYFLILGVALYFATAYTTIHIGLNGSRIRLGIKIKKKEQHGAIEFIDQLDKSRFSA